MVRSLKGENNQNPSCNLENLWTSALQQAHGGFCLPVSHGKTDGLTDIHFSYAANYCITIYGPF